MTGSKAAIAPALGAIALWGTLALLAVELSRVPPFLLTGTALAIGSLVGARGLAAGPPPWRALALGVYGLFGFHFFLFMALRHAPPVQANLVNYLWPLLIVVLAPLLVPGVAFSKRHAIAACVGFAGAAGLIVGRGGWPAGGEALGYAFALASALIWSTYSLLTRRFAGVPGSAVAWFCAISAALALACHAAFEPRYVPQGLEWLWLALLGAGPMGAAFFLWDRAMKHGDPRVIGSLAYLAPLLSTVLLIVVAGAAWTPLTLVAMALIVAGAWLGK